MTITITIDGRLPHQRPAGGISDIEILAEPIECVFALPCGKATEVDVQDFVAAGGWIDTEPQALR